MAVYLKGEPHVDIIGRYWILSTKLQSGGSSALSGTRLGLSTAGGRVTLLGIFGFLVAMHQKQVPIISLINSASGLELFDAVL